MKFSIEQYCWNAGKVKNISGSSYQEEEETLIPPYSVCKVIKHDDNYFELDLAPDNQDVDLSQETIY